MTEQPKIEVCFGPECSDKGGRELAKELQNLGYTIMMGDCRSQCANSPLVLVSNQSVIHASCEKVLMKVQDVQNKNTYTSCDRGSQ